MARCDLPGVNENTAQVAPGNRLPLGGPSSGWDFGTVVTHCEPSDVERYVYVPQLMT